MIGFNDMRRLRLESSMKTTYTFDALVEAVAVQAGLDTSVPEAYLSAHNTCYRHLCK